MPKALCKQSKLLIASLISYFERERDNGGALLPLGAVREVILPFNINIGRRVLTYYIVYCRG